MANKFALSQPNTFWQEMRITNGKLFKCIQDNDVNTRMINAEYSADIIVTSDKVAMAIRKLSTGKSSGLDGIYGNIYCIAVRYW